MCWQSFVDVIASTKAGVRVKAQRRQLRVVLEAVESRGAEVILQWLWQVWLAALELRQRALVYSKLGSLVKLSRRREEVIRRLLQAIDDREWLFVLRMSFGGWCIASKAGCLEFATEAYSARLNIAYGARRHCLQQMTQLLNSCDAKLLVQTVWSRWRDEALHRQIEVCKEGKQAEAHSLLNALDERLSFLLDCWAPLKEVRRCWRTWAGTVLVRRVEEQAAEERASFALHIRKRTAQAVAGCVARAQIQSFQASFSQWASVATGVAARNSTVRHALQLQWARESLAMARCCFVNWRTSLVERESSRRELELREVLSHTQDRVSTYLENLVRLPVGCAKIGLVGLVFLLWVREIVDRHSQARSLREGQRLASDKSEARRKMVHRLGSRASIAVYFRVWVRAS